MRVVHPLPSHPLSLKPPLFKSGVGNTIYRPTEPPMTSSPTTSPTSAATSSLCLCPVCHVSTKSPFRPRYTTKNLRHDDVITKKRQKPVKPKFCLKTHESDFFHPFIFVDLCNLCMQITTNLPPKLQSVTLTTIIRHPALQIIFQLANYSRALR